MNVFDSLKRGWMAFLMEDNLKNKGQTLALVGLFFKKIELKQVENLLKFEETKIKFKWSTRKFEWSTGKFKWSTGKFKWSTGKFIWSRKKSML